MLQLAIIAAVPWIATTTIPSVGFADTQSGDLRVTGSPILMPPLPLVAANDSQSPKINPFCELAPTAPSIAIPTLGAPRAMPATSNHPIQLMAGNVWEPTTNNHADDGEGSIVRLIPLESSPAKLPVDQRNGIKTNPIATRFQEICEMPAAGGSAPTPAVVHKADHLALRKSPTIPTPRPVVAQVDATAVHEGPVAFSLDDTQVREHLVDIAKADARKTSTLGSLVHHEKQSQSRKTTRAFNRPKPVTIEDVGNNEPITITRGTASSRTLLVPLSNEHVPKSMPTATADDARIVKGGRPPVDVGVPPVAITRSFEPNRRPSEQSNFAPIVAAVKTEEPVLQTTASVFELKRTEVRSLVAGGEIKRVDIGDPSICTAIPAGASQLNVIGTTDGRTELAVWTLDANGVAQRCVYEIRVGATAKEATQDYRATADALARTVKAALPDADLSVQFDKGQMVVAGVCSSDDTAKRALRMIRSACLLPVVDKIKIR